MNLILAKKLGLTKKEILLFKKLSSPEKVQDFLNTFGERKVRRGEVEYRSPRKVLERKRAHCIEGALLAALAFWLHGRKPIILDLKVRKPDVDHVITIFKEGKRFGAVSRSNYYSLRYRDPVYRNIRELVMSYYHEYFLEKSGEKTLVSYSEIFNLSKYKNGAWATTQKDLYPLVEKLDFSKHHSVLPRSGYRGRRADRIERNVQKVKENRW